MFSFQIEHFLSGNPYFLGCFPKNKLPPMPTSFPKTIIVNTQDSNQPGEHWLALVLMKNKCFYFDSFGLGVIEYEIKEYLKCKYNNVTYLINVFNILQVISVVSFVFCLLNSLKIRSHI